MNITTENKKQKAIEIMNELDIYKPYIKGFRENNQICFFENFGGFGTLVFDYYDEETHVTQSYVFYTLKQAISKFRKDNGLQYKRIKIPKLF